MHSNILWFDTAACLDDGHIGDVNKVTISPTTARYSKRPANTEDLCDSIESSDGVTTCKKYEEKHNLDGEFGNPSWWRGTAWSTVNPAKSEAANKDNPAVADRLFYTAAEDLPYVDTYRPDSQTV